MSNPTPTEAEGGKCGECGKEICRSEACMCISDCCRCVLPCGVCGKKKCKRKFCLEGGMDLRCGAVCCGGRAYPPVAANSIFDVTADDGSTKAWDGTTAAAAKGTACKPTVCKTCQKEACPLCENGNCDGKTKEKYPNLCHGHGNSCPSCWKDKCKDRTCNVTVVAGGMHDLCHGHAKPTEAAGDCGKPKCPDYLSGEHETNPKEHFDKYCHTDYCRLYQEACSVLLPFVNDHNETVRWLRNQNPDEVAEALAKAVATAEARGREAGARAVEVAVKADAVEFEIQYSDSPNNKLKIATRAGYKGALAAATRAAEGINSGKV